MPTLAELRRNYELAGLSEDDAGDDPFALFRRWFDQTLAAELPEPNAFILATCTPDGAPSARTVLLKALDDRGFTFFTNYDSRKGREMAANPRVAMVFLWHQLERQVRIEGVVERVTAQESDDYFVNRPLGSRLGAWASAQSAVIPDRAYLEARHAELMARYPVHAASRKRLGARPALALSQPAAPAGDGPLGPRTQPHVPTEGVAPREPSSRLSSS
jgi:pyridoxamine 5'-phosphate oxidase